MVECIGEGWIIITGLWQGLVVSDGLNGLPQGRVSLLSVKWLLIFWAYDRFAFLMPQDRLALAVLRAALSPDLNASSLVFSSPRTSAVIHGFWFARVWWWSWWLSHHPCTFWCKQSQFQCTPAGLCGCCRGRLFKHVPVCALKAVLYCWGSILWPNCDEFLNRFGEFQKWSILGLA